MTTERHQLGQYFTTSVLLQDKVAGFIRNNPTRILEPSVGRGDLVDAVLRSKKNVNIVFDMYEIDGSLAFLDCIRKRRRCLHIQDFLASDSGLPAHADFAGLLWTDRIPQTGRLP